MFTHGSCKPDKTVYIRGQYTVPSDAPDEESTLVTARGAMEGEDATSCPIPNFGTALATRYNSGIRLSYLVYHCFIDAGLPSCIVLLEKSRSPIVHDIHSVHGTNIETSSFFDFPSTSGRESTAWRPCGHFQSFFCHLS